MTDSDPLQELDEPLAEDRQSEESGVAVPTAERPHAERPSADVPDPPSTRTEELRTQASDVDPAFKTLFWKLVFLYKIAVLGLTLGILLWVFDSHPTRGPALTVGGVLLFLYAIELTRRGKARLDAGEFDLETEN
ncbi:hypothetical protein ACFQJ7_01100 [Halovenus rubra]|uniref:Uncharacterized protein n=2 Tax=Halovenus rubra TaxID=869890 RepID=A0ACC7E195_9EURY|nr:hypothetical protein [Halovenus rubra]